MKTRVFQLAFERKNLFNGAIKLFENKKIIGTIPDISFKKNAEINGRKFSITNEGSFWFPKKYCLVDQQNSQVIGIISQESSGLFIVLMSDKTKYDISVSRSDNPAQNNGHVIQFYFEDWFYKKPSTIEVRSEKHVEELIVSAYFVLYLRSD